MFIITQGFGSPLLITQGFGGIEVPAPIVEPVQTSSGGSSTRFNLRPRRRPKDIEDDDELAVVLMMMEG